MNLSKEYTQFFEKSLLCFFLYDIIGVRISHDNGFFAVNRSQSLNDMILAVVVFIRSIAADAVNAGSAVFIGKISAFGYKLDMMRNSAIICIT